MIVIKLPATASTLVTKDGAPTLVKNDSKILTNTSTEIYSKAVIGLGNVDNVSDLNKQISTATQSALDLKSFVASPVFTGSFELARTSTNETVFRIESTHELTDSGTRAQLSMAVCLA